MAKQIKEITSEEIDQSVIENALKRVEFSSELDQGIIQEFADFPGELGFVEGSTQLDGLFKVV